MWVDWRWRGTTQLHDCLRDCATHGEARRQMRALLSGQDHLDVSRLNDRQLVMAVATLVASGHLKVMRKALTPQALLKHGIKQMAVVKYTADTPAITPSQGTGRTFEAPPAAPLIQLEHDFSAARVDQDAQAATLKAAADQGVPFCEVCAKAAAAANNPSRPAMAA